MSDIPLIFEDLIVMCGSPLPIFPLRQVHENTMSMDLRVIHSADGMVILSNNKIPCLGVQGDTVFSYPAISVLFFKIIDCIGYCFLVCVYKVVMA